VIGQVLRPHGIRGELRVRSLTENAERYRLLQRLYLNLNGIRTCFTIERLKITPAAVLLKLEAVDTRDDAERYRDALVEIEGEAVLPLAKGRYYYFELDGLTVETDAGEVIGRVTDVIGYPAHDVYVVTSETREYLIPAIAEIVIKVDMERQVMVIHALDGLLD